jgi:predicted DNA-binding WGR domain protein
MEIVALESISPAENRFRFYVLSLDETLFGDVALVREWGRIGTNGRRRLDLFDDRVRAISSLEDWLERKRRRGYEVVESSLPIPPRQISPRQPAQKGASASIAPSRSYRPRNAAG